MVGPAGHLTPAARKDDRTPSQVSSIGSIATPQVRATRLFTEQRPNETPPRVGQRLLVYGPPPTENPAPICSSFGLLGPTTERPRAIESGRSAPRPPRRRRPPGQIHKTTLAVRDPAESVAFCANTSGGDRGPGRDALPAIGASLTPSLISYTQALAVSNGFGRQQRGRRRAPLRRLR